MNYEKTTIGLHCIVTSSKRFHASERTKDGVPFYCSKEIIKKVNGEKITECDYISEDAYNRVKEEYGVPQTGDLLITTRGTYGIPYIYKEYDKFYFADGNLTWLKDFDDKLDAEYLYYWINSYEGQKKIDAIAKGTAQKAVPIALLKEIEIVIPENPIQKKVVVILKNYDQLIENNKKQIKLLEEAAQRLYKEWFIDLRFPGYENCKIVDGVPVEWKKKKLDEIADVIMGQSPKSEFYNKEHKGLPFHQGVGSYGARFVQDDTYSTSFTKVAEANSILFSVRAPVGRLNITKNKIVIGRGIAAINSKSGFQSYLFYALKERFFKDDILGNGAIFASISKNELLNQVFVIPDEKIMLAYEKIAAALDKKIEVVDMQLQQLVEARDRLLPKLMNGEIEV